VSGLLLYSEERKKIRKFFEKKPTTDNLHDTNPTILRKQTPVMTPAAGTIHNFAIRRQTTISQHLPTYLDPLIEFIPQFVEYKAEIPFLRRTSNRMDMVALVSFWIYFCLAMTGVKQVYIFKTLAALRTLRLINIIFGSWMPMYALKKSVPLLVNITLSASYLFVIIR